MSSQSPDFWVCGHSLEMALDQSPFHCTCTVKLNNISSPCSNEECALGAHIHRSDARAVLDLASQVKGLRWLELIVPLQDLAIVSSSEECIRQFATLDRPDGVIVSFDWLGGSRAIPFDQTTVLGASHEGSTVDVGDAGKCNVSHGLEVRALFAVDVCTRNVENLHVLNTASGELCLTLPGR